MRTSAQVADKEINFSPLTLSALDLGENQASESFSQQMMRTFDGCVDRTCVGISLALLSIWWRRHRDGLSGPSTARPRTLNQGNLRQVNLPIRYSRRACRKCQSEVFQAASMHWPDLCLSCTYVHSNEWQIIFARLQFGLKITGRQWLSVVRYRRRPTSVSNAYNGRTKKCP